MKAIEDIYDIYVHYDTDVTPDVDIMGVQFQRAGYSWWTAHNICIRYKDGYVPDPYSGFLVISGMCNAQPGSVSVCGGSKAGRRQDGIFFPLREPADDFPKCKVYNRIQVEKSDRFEVKYADAQGEFVDVDRIVVTFHVSDDIRRIYID